MALKHRVRINIADTNGVREPVIRSDVITLPGRILHWLFGEPARVMVLMPGDSVKHVVISEDREEETGDEAV